MISEERFNEIAGEVESRGMYPCGYYHVCWEHACPCRAGMEPFNEDTYKAIQKEAREVVEQAEREGLFDDDYDDHYDADD